MDASSRLAGRSSPGRRTVRFAMVLGTVVVLGLILVSSASAATITYNLFATDGYAKMADGQLVYMYGFVGGRQGQPLVYQNSATASPDPSAVVTVTAGAPAPTPGPNTALETQLQGNAQFPAPMIYAAVGDIVEIRLKNLGVKNPTAPNDPHSIHLHGLDVNAANDGVPETAVAAVPASYPASPNDPLPPGAGNVVVYMFSPKFQGTYMYHCHQEADIHVQMGMYGALVVYNKTDPAYLHGGPGKGFGGDYYGRKYDKDVVMLLSEVDTRQHVSEELSQDPAFNPVDFHPQYWFVNGLSFPNTIHADGGSGFVWSDWLRAHPNYDPFIVGSVSKKSADCSRGEKVLIRVINMGFETQPMHMHGYHGKVLGSDQRPWLWSNNEFIPFGKGLEKQTLTIGSGETYEWLIDMGQQGATSTYPNGTGGMNGTFPGGTQSRFASPSVEPTSNTKSLFPAIPDPFIPPFTYVGGPIVGPKTGQNDNTLLLAIDPNNQGQYFPFHNHDDYKATNNGAYPGGQFTMIKTLP
jgi:manganese oxidase